MIASEGMYTGMFVFAGAKAALHMGNTTQLKRVPDGCVICNLEGKIGDRGTIAKCSGDYATVVAHDVDRKRVKVRLPSGTKKWFKEDAAQPSALLPEVVVSTNRCSRQDVPSTSTASSATHGQRLVVLPRTLWSTLTVVEITSTLVTLRPPHAPP